MDFRELYVAELKAVGFSAADADEIADWYCASADMATSSKQKANQYKQR